MPRLCANLSMLFTELEFLQRFEAVCQQHLGQARHQCGQ